MLFLSNDKYTRQYETDLLREVIHDNASAKVIAVTSSSDDTQIEESFVYIKNGAVLRLSPIFPYLMLAQAFAFHSSIALGIHQITHLQLEKLIGCSRCHYLPVLISRRWLHAFLMINIANNKRNYMHAPNIVWTRIDERLLHGQIRITWVNTLKQI